MTGFWVSPLSLPVRMLGFIGWFLGQFVVTSLRVVALIATPGKQPEPAIVRIKIEDLSEAETTLLIALITITPDTLVIALDREEGSLFVHGIFAARDPEGFRASLRKTHDRLLHGVRLRPETVLNREGKA
jgi:multicomponent Na+:H+ antiporter subunit E